MNGCSSNGNNLRTMQPGRCTPAPPCRTSGKQLTIEDAAEDASHGLARVCAATCGLLGVGQLHDVAGCGGRGGKSGGESAATTQRREAGATRRRRQPLKPPVPAGIDTLLHADSVTVCTGGLLRALVTTVGAAGPVGGAKAWPSPSPARAGCGERCKCQKQQQHGRRRPAGGCASHAGLAGWLECYRL